MKRKLLFAIVALLCAVGMKAQAWQDLTSRLTNPSFESGDLTGWTVIGESTSEALTSGSYAKASEDLAVFNANGGAAADGEKVFKLKQWWSNHTAVFQTAAINLPAGTYKLTANLQNKEEGSGNPGNYELGYIKNTVSESHAPLTFTESTSGSFAEAMHGTIIEKQFTLNEATDVTFAAQSVVWGGHHFQADDFRLYQLLETGDVTSSYLTNFNFASGTPIDNGVCTYGKDMAGNETTYYSALAIDGWTNASVGETDSGYDNSKLAGALFAYGGTPWLAGKGTTAPATDPEGNAGNAAGLCAVWGGRIQYTQDVTLPAGSYTVKFQVYNSTTNNGSGSFITTNLFGFDANEGTDYFAPNRTFAIGQWSTVAVTFNLAAETAGKISMGYVGPTGNAAMPHLFVDNVKIIRNTDYQDATTKFGVAQADWTGASDGLQGTAFKTSDGRDARMAAFYGSSAAGDKIYQTVNTLDKGTYEAVVYAYSMNEWGNHGATLANDAGDVGYVLADGKYQVKEWINARKGTHNANDYGIYTLSGIEVDDDGELKLAYVIDKANQTEWMAIQIQSLIRTGGLLSDIAEDLPYGGEMIADTWYRINPGAGTFNLTATNLGNIVYTTSNLFTYEAGSVSATFGENPVAFTNAIYYIKSSSDNNFAYEADSYDLTEQIAAYNTAVTNAGTAKTNAEAAAKVNAAEKTALDDAITAYGDIDTSGPWNKALKDALETATPILVAATNAVNTSITAYAKAKTYFDAVEPVLATTNAYTSAAYESNYSTPKAAYEAGTLSDVDAAALSYGSRRDGSMPAILLSSWAGTTLYINTWSTEAEGVAPARDFANPFFEYWVGDGNNLGANTFTSTIGGLTANALYAVTLTARVKQRDGNRKVAEGITLKVGEGDAVDLTQGKHIGMTRRFIDSYTAYGYTDGEGNLVTTITVAANSNISWLAFRDVNYAHVEGASALNTVVAEVTDLNGHVPTNVYSTAYTAVTNHTDANYPTTDAEFATAISEIRTAAATAATYKDEYEAYLELKDYADALVAVPNNNASANSTLAASISTAATNVNSVADVAALTSVNTTLKAAMVTYAGAANPVGDGQKFDLTFMLGKVNFDDCIAWENPTVNGFSGWATEQAGGNFQVMENESVTSGDYHSFIEYWSADPLANSKFNLYTSVSALPEGTYTMSCYAFAGPNGYAGAGASSEVYFYANDTQGGKVSDEKLTQKEITFVNASEQDVKIGLKPVTGNTWRWMGIGYVKMYKVPAAADVVLNENSAYVETETAADVVLTKTIYEGFNTVILPFSMTAEEVADVLGAGTLYAFTDADAGVLDFSTVSSLAAHTPYLFKADADKAITGQRIAGRTITISTNSLTTVGTDYNFVGTYAPYAQGESPIIVGTDYVLGNDNNFYQATVKNAMKAFRAYIKANEPSLVKALVISLDGEATGIQSINGQSLNEGAIYNLAGQRMNKVQRGVNIVNGKKVLVK